LTYLNEEKSSITSDGRSDTLLLSKMRRKMTAATQSKISVKELNPFSDEAQLETLLCEALFENDKERFEKFVSEQMVILDKLRRALYHIDKRNLWMR